jgi:hypothetical protein
MQQRLGHATGTTTMYYTHVIGDTARRTAANLENTILHTGTVTLASQSPVDRKRPSPRDALEDHCG